MKIPQTPPDLSQLLKRVKSEEMKLVFQTASPLPTGKYLHWDDVLRFSPARAQCLDAGIALAG
jgi:hypothetical protein